MSGKILDLELFLSRHLDEIATCFVCPVELSVIVRVPGNDDADVFFGSLSLEDAQALLARRQSEETDQPQAPSAPEKE